MRIAVLHGPNLGRLGQREPEIYGATTLAEVDDGLIRLGRELGVEVETFQSNHEGELVDFIEAATERVSGFVVNGAGLTHTSVVLRDALVGSGRPFTEVHLSNTSAREAFRARSLLSPVATGVVYGFGPESYLLGLRGLVSHLSPDPGT